MISLAICEKNSGLAGPLGKAENKHDMISLAICEENSGLAGP